MINRKQLKSQAGTAAFERGVGYFERGFVGSLRIQQYGVQEIRLRHKPKRNLMKLMNENRL